MTTQQTAAIERAAAQHITIAARGVVKASGQRFYVINGSTSGTQYTVLVNAHHLACSCPAGQHGRVCKHRAAVHVALQAERTAATESREARYTLAAARRESAPLARSNAPVSMWK